MNTNKAFLKKNQVKSHVTLDTVCVGIWNWLDKSSMIISMRNIFFYTILQSIEFDQLPTLISLSQKSIAKWIYHEIKTKFHDKLKKKLKIKLYNQ